MDQSSKISTAVAKTILLLFGLMMVAIFLLKGELPSTRAHAQQEERVFENTLPKDVPLKVEIKKEKEESFKDVKNDKWVRELELTRYRKNS